MTERWRLAGRTGRVGYVDVEWPRRSPVAHVSHAHKDGSRGWPRPNARAPRRRARAHRPRPLIIVDEVGYIPFDPEAAALFFALVCSRYERSSIIVSSTRPSRAGPRSSATRSPSLRSSALLEEKVDSDRESSALADAPSRQVSEENARVCPRWCAAPMSSLAGRTSTARSSAQTSPTSSSSTDCSTTRATSICASSWPSGRGSTVLALGFCDTPGGHRRAESISKCISTRGPSSSPPPRSLGAVGVCQLHGVCPRGQGTKSGASHANMGARAVSSPSLVMEVVSKRIVFVRMERPGRLPARHRPFHEYAAPSALRTSTPCPASSRSWTPSRALSRSITSLRSCSTPSWYPRRAGRTPRPGQTSCSG